MRPDHSLPDSMSFPLRFYLAIFPIELGLRALACVHFGNVLHTICCTAELLCFCAEGDEWCGLHLKQKTDDIICDHSRFTRSPDKPCLFLMAAGWDGMQHSRLP